MSSVSENGEGPLSLPPPELPSQCEDELEQTGFCSRVYFRLEANDALFYVDP